MSMFNKSNNPVINGIPRTNDYVESGDMATYSGVSGKLLFLLALATFSALFSFTSLTTMGPGTLILAFVFAMVGIIGASYSTQLSGMFSMVYALAEGYLIGYISGVYNYLAPGIVPTALFATFAVFFVMVILYSTGVIRVGNVFRRVMISALLGYFFFIAIILISSIFTPTLMELFFGLNSNIAFALGIALVVFAAFFLLLDFDNVSRIVQSGADKQYEWRAALGVMVGLIWLYIQILRLLLIITARRR